MSCSGSLLTTGAFPSSSLRSNTNRLFLPSITIKSGKCQPPQQNHNFQCKFESKAINEIFVKPINSNFSLEKTSLLIHLGVVLASVEQPVFAVTGNNNYETDLIWTLIQAGIVAFLYFLVVPPVVLNWIRLRFYKRRLLETYLQFMCVFLFFPGILLWAPFLNFRRFPRDPSMKYPWSTPQPQDPSINDSQSL